MSKIDKIPPLSIVSTIYKTGAYLPEFTERIMSSSKEAGYDPASVEVIFVNDGCPDNGLLKALALQEKFPNVRVMELSRNFGHHKAMMAGLREARGEHVFLIDSDLEESPEWLVEFRRQLHEQKCEAVFGVQRSRKGGRVERLSGELFYRVFNMLSSRPIVPNSVTARLMTRSFVTALTELPESEPFLFGLAEFIGFKQFPFLVDKKNNSPSSYTFLKKLRLALYSVISFSSRPLLYIAAFGSIVTSFSALCILYMLLKYIFLGIPVPGWTSVIVSIWFIGGVIIMCLGISSLYLAKVYEEVKHRPSVVIKKIHSKS